MIIQWLSRCVIFTAGSGQMLFFKAPNFFVLNPMSQKLTSSSVARIKIWINSSMRPGDTFCTCSSSKARDVHFSPDAPLCLHLGLWSYLTQASRLSYNPRRHSSQPISRTGSRRGESARRSIVAGRWHHIRSDKVPRQSGGLTSPLFDPRREYICYKQCKLIENGDIRSAEHSKWCVTTTYQ